MAKSTLESPTTTASATAATSRRDERRLARHDISRTQLLDAAEELFGRKGYHETTLKEIAEQAEFSVGSVYSFFENKDDLYIQVFLRRGDELLPAIERIVTGGDTATAALHALVDHEIGFFHANPAFGRLYLRSSDVSLTSLVPDAAAALASNVAEAFALEAGLFERGQRSGEFRSGDPATLARLFSGLIVAYQAADPVVIGDDPTAAAPLSLTELHDLIEGAFCR